MYSGLEMKRCHLVFNLSHESFGIKAQLYNFSAHELVSFAFLASLEAKKLQIQAALSSVNTEDDFTNIC